MAVKMNIKVVLGENVKLYRKKRNLTQEALSEMLGINAKALSKIETGSKFVSSELLESICKTLKVSASALFYDNISEIGDSGFAKIEKIIDEKMGNVSKELKREFRSVFLNED